MSTRRFVITNKTELRNALKNSEAFVALAKQNNYEALIFPLAAFASGNTRSKLVHLKQLALKQGIALEAGGWDLSSLLPRWYFFFQRDSFRMEGGRRKKDHHFCPTSLTALKIIEKTGKKLFWAAAGIEVFHLWSDKGAETAWCSCPTCRAFTPQEQNRIAVNAAADVLSAINPNASITYLEKPNEPGNVPLRKNIVMLENLIVDSQTMKKESFN